jgi:hypothetical protein
MQDYDHRPYQAHGTPKLAQYSEFFVQEVCTQYRPDQYTQCAEGSDQNSRRKGVCCKIEELAEPQQAHAEPPKWCSEVLKAVSFEAVLVGRIIETFLGYNEAAANG